MSSVLSLGWSRTIPNKSIPSCLSGGIDLLPDNRLVAPQLGLTATSGVLPTSTKEPPWRSRSETCSMSNEFNAPRDHDLLGPPDITEAQLAERLSQSPPRPRRTPLSLWPRAPRSLGELLRRMLVVIILVVVPAILDVLFLASSHRALVHKIGLFAPLPYAVTIVLIMSLLTRRDS